MQDCLSRWLLPVILLTFAVTWAGGAAPPVESRPLKLWTGTLDVPRDKIDGFTLSPDGHTLFTTTRGRNISVWDLPAGKLVRGRPLTDQEYSPSQEAFVSGGKEIACTALGDLYVLDIRTLELRLAHKQSDPYWVGSLVASADGAFVAGQNGRYLGVWDVAKARLVWHKVFDKEGRGFDLGSVAISPDSRVLAVGVKHGSDAAKREVARLYDAKTGRELRRLTCDVRGPGRHLVYSQDGRWLAMAFGWESKLHVWDARTGEHSRVLTWEPKSERFLVYRLGLSPDGTSLSIFTADEVRLYETATWGLRRVIDGGFSDFRLCFGNRFVRLDRDAGRVDVERWREPAKVGPRTKGELRRLWTALGSDHAGATFGASQELLAVPEQAVELLSRLPRVEPVSGDLAKLVADLDHDDYDVRENASEKLAKAGPAAEVFLRAAWAAGPGPEARRRIAPLLKPLDGTGPARLRFLRGVEVLEALGTPQAVKQLERLAAGAEGAVETQDAKAALARSSRITK